MTIGTPVIGATATGNNTSVSPTFPPTPAVGDLMLCFASIRNSGAGSPDQPSGWSTVLDLGNFKIFGKYFASTDTAPTITFTGGVANADTQAAIIKVPGAAPNQLTARVVATLTNASAQNIAYPALDVPGPGNLVLIAAWKQDDATTITGPGGFTGIVNSFVTAGDDASLRVLYSVQTSEADIAAGSLTVTGGAAAISKAAVIAIMPAATFAVTLQDAQYPPRAVLALSGLLGNEVINLYRVVAGTRTRVRGGQLTNTSAVSAIVRIDAELPFGVPVYWVAEVNGAEYTAGSQTVSLPGGKVAFTDAITGLAAEAVILSWPELSYDRQVSVYRLAAGQTKTVSRPSGQFSGRLEVFTEAAVSKELMRTLLQECTSNVIQIRQPGGYEDVDCYVTVTGWTERRFSQDGTDDRRVFALDVVEVNGWADTFEAAGYDYADLAALYSTPLTYANLASDYATYLVLSTSELEP